MWPYPVVTICFLYIYIYYSYNLFSLYTYVFYYANITGISIWFAPELSLLISLCNYVFWGVTFSFSDGLVWGTCPISFWNSGFGSFSLGSELSYWFNIFQPLETCEFNQLPWKTVISLEVWGQNWKGLKVHFLCFRTSRLSLVLPSFCYNIWKQYFFQIQFYQFWGQQIEL